jgi:hypothetical protein
MAAAEMNVTENKFLSERIQLGPKGQIRVDLILSYIKVSSGWEV